MKCYSVGELIAWVFALCAAAGFAQLPPDARSEQGDKTEVDSLREYLNGYSIGANEADIRSVLQRLADSNQDWTRERQLLGQLGSEQFPEREAAQAALCQMPAISLDLLEDATRDPDPEIAVRANQILEVIRLRRVEVVEKVCRAIELLELSGLGEELAGAVTPSLSESSVAAAAKRAMAVTATKEDVPFLSAQVDRETGEPLRVIALRALRRLEVATLADTFARWARDDRLSESNRLESTLALADLGDRRSMDLLVELMVEGAITKTRVRSEVALKILTGRAFVFAAKAEKEVRVQQAQRWKDWIASSGSTSRLRFPLRSAQSCILNGHMLVALGRNPGPVIEYDTEMNEVWRYDCGFPANAEMMENGHFLIAVASSDRVIEVNREKVIVRGFEVLDLRSARPLENGNVLVVCGGMATENDRQGTKHVGRKAIEVNPEGEVVRELKSEANGGNIYDAIRLPNDHTMVLEWREGVQRTCVVEYNRDGQELWSKGPLGDGSEVEAFQVLEDGNVFVSVLDGRVLEIDRVTQEVRESAVEGVRDAFRLPDGRTLFLSKERIGVVDQEGKETTLKSINTISGSIRQ